MTLTLEIPETLERTFREAAKRRGIAPEKYFAELVERAAKASTVLADAPAINGTTTNGTGAQSTLSRWSEAAERLAPLYEQSLREDGELTAFSTAPADVYEYSADDLAAMEAGTMERSAA